MVQGLIVSGGLTDMSHQETEIRYRKIHLKALRGLDLLNSDDVEVIDWASKYIAELEAQVGKWLHADERDRDDEIAELKQGIRVLQSLNEGLRMMYCDDEAKARVFESLRAEGRAEGRDECLAQQVTCFNKDPKIVKGFELGIAAYRAIIRSLGANP